MADTERTRRVRTPLFPLYSEVRALLPVLEGVSKDNVRELIKEILEHTGTPQDPVDWSDPDTWIGERLSGQHRALAQRLWEGTHKTVNPRHIYGSYLFIYGYDLIASDVASGYCLTERGKRFLDDDPKVVREIDQLEGLPDLLAILATKSQAKRSDLIPEWSEFLRAYSRYGTDSTIKDTLRRRLLNVVERGFARRDGNKFDITTKGLGYATTGWRREDEPHRKVIQTINTYNAGQLGLLRERLSEMHPKLFERLIGDLLEAMGYEDVEVTKESGDKGIDVTGSVQVGITTVREVIQVKRHKATIGRPILDQLRGVLPLHQAIRGTLITLSRFTKQCSEAALYPGAAPITLIDGDRLIQLLLEHEVAIKKREVFLSDIDEAYFEVAPEDALAETDAD